MTKITKITKKTAERHPVWVLELSCFVWRWIETEEERKIERDRERERERGKRE